MTKQIDWTLIRQEWETSKVTYKALAEKYGVKVGTLKSRSSREKWSRNKDATKKKKVATFERKLQPKIDDEEPVELSDELNDKQQLFCIYYIKYLNATKAYQKAYGCEYTSAMTGGSRMLRNAKILREIEHLKNKQLDKVGLSAEAVLQKYIDIAFADVDDFIKTDGYSIELKPLDEVDTSVLSEVVATEFGPKIKLVDKMKALDMLAKYTDLLNERQYKLLQIKKAEADIARLKGEDSEEYEDDGFLEAIKGTVDIWSEGNE